MDSEVTTKLMVYLKGGGSCASIETCQGRCKNGNSLCTTSQEETMKETEGIWSSNQEENPAFYDYNKIYVPYCSSDVWTGAGAQLSDSRNFTFHGHYIVEAVVEDILKEWNIQQLQQLVLIGTSAGAFGVGHNCDRVADRLHQDLPSLDVRCIADSGDFFPLLSKNPDECNTLLGFEMAQDFWHAISDESCLEQDNPLLCVTYMTAYPFVSTPFMVIHHYLDTIVHGFCTPEIGQDPSFWTKWHEEMKTLAEDYMLEKPDNGLYIINCPFHTITKNMKAWNEWALPEVGFSDNTIILKNLVNNWLTGQRPYQAMDTPTEQHPECPSK